MRDRDGSAHRIYQVLATISAAALVAFLLARLATHAPLSDVWLLGVAGILGYVAADFVSGLVHWIFDSWGSVETPVVGRSFVLPFREHHSDAASITRHDFFETNGNTSIAALPVLVGTCFIPVSTASGLFAVALLLSMGSATLVTNQIHKWAHTPDPGPVIVWLQRKRLILSPDHHRLHHEAPYATHYCITTGWLNPILHAVGFYARLERVVTALTGAQPREASD